MPAAAVIPAPIAYIKVVAVKKLVVEIEEKDGLISTIDSRSCPSTSCISSMLFIWVLRMTGKFTLKKLECLKQAYACILLHGIME